MKCINVLLLRGCGDGKERISPANHKVMPLAKTRRDVRQKNGTQLKAVKLVNEKTSEQNTAFDIFLKLILKIQSAAKSAFETAIDTVRKKDAGQLQAQETLRQRTADQDAAMERACRSLPARDRSERDECETLSRVMPTLLHEY